MKSFHKFRMCLTQSLRKVNRGTFYVWTSLIKINPCIIERAYQQNGTKSLRCEDWNMASKGVSDSQLSMRIVGDQASGLCWHCSCFTSFNICIRGAAQCAGSWPAEWDIHKCLSTSSRFLSRFRHRVLRIPRCKYIQQILQCRCLKGIIHKVKIQVI